MSVNFRNFSCVICMSSNTDCSNNTELWGHFDRSSKVGQQARWIHGICAECFNSNESNFKYLEKCPTCQLKNVNIEKITVTSSGVIERSKSRTSEMPDKIFIKHMESVGSRIGKIGLPLVAAGAAATLAGGEEKVALLIGVGVGVAGTAGAAALVAGAGAIRAAGAISAVASGIAAITVVAVGATGFAAGAVGPAIVAKGVVIAAGTVGSVSVGRAAGASLGRLTGRAAISLSDSWNSQVKGVIPSAEQLGNWD